MTEIDLIPIFENVLKTYFKKKSYTHVHADFYRTKSLSHTIRMEAGTFTLKISDAFVQAPLQIIQIIGIILFSKIFRHKIDREVRQIYKQYIYENLDESYRSVNIRKPSDDYTATGKYYNLDDIFNRLNIQYFENKLEKPILGWSLNKSYTRLGFYSSEKNLLVISRIFDSRKTTQNVVEYLMFHEMLHIFFPVETVNGRRRVHTPEFRRQERSFPDYDKINKWIHKKRFRL
ncbi:DUF45 domain-containing protein [bacterium]|nr:DUF45 domain-containing protein [bacterium]